MEVVLVPVFQLPWLPGIWVARWHNDGRRPIFVWPKPPPRDSFVEYSCVVTPADPYRG